MMLKCSSLEEEVAAEEMDKWEYQNYYKMEGESDANKGSKFNLKQILISWNIVHLLGRILPVFAAIWELHLGLEYTVGLFGDPLSPQ